MEFLEGTLRLDSMQDAAFELDAFRSHRRRGVLIPEPWCCVVCEMDGRCNVAMGTLQQGCSCLPHPDREVLRFVISAAKMPCREPNLQGAV